MPTVTINVVNAFVDAGKGGNPAGVVLDADSITNETKQGIAAAAGLSETAFVSRSASAGFKLEFFTPTRQIAHCGHATIATFAYLLQQGRVKGPQTSKETIDGNRDIFLVDDMAFMQQNAPRYTPLDGGVNGVTTEAVLASLALSPTDLRPGEQPIIVNNGVNGLMVPLRSEGVLRRIRPDFGTIERISELLDLVEYYVFSLETQVRGRDAGARMFAPRYGIPEEAATGMAAGALACYLHDFGGVKKTEMIIEQGRLMTPPSPSELTARLTVVDGSIRYTIVGGRATLSRTIEVDC
jgi:PhzF family phenazine biosynthesis protein